MNISNILGLGSYLTYDLSQEGEGFQRLLKTLSTKEITILQRHPDLINRVRRIDKMGSTELTNELKDGFGLEVDHLRNGSTLISLDQVLDFLPGWMDKPIETDFEILGGLGKFLTWAEDFLMQEVRVNIWIRYIEHKKSLRSLGQW